MNPETVLFSAAMGAYLIGFACHSLSASLAREGLYKWGRYAIGLGALLASVALILRWNEAGHPPLSNMYESMVTMSTFLAWVVLLFTRNTPIPLAEAGGAVLAVLMIGIGSLFAKESRPLVPALQSYWLHIHVAIAFVGESCFALSFVLSYLFCLRRFLEDPATPGSRPVAPLTGSEWVANLGVVFGLPVLFLVMMGAIASRLAGQPDAGGRMGIVVVWVMLPVAVTLVAVLAAIFFFRGSIGKAVERWMPSGEVLDDLTYRAIAFGFPLFTVGALIFGMVWANKAWGRYWGWDPKETWALITFLVYSIYLHVRLTRGWQGTWTAVLSVVGFVVTMFTLFGVNLLLAGLHSYGSS